MDQIGHLTRYKASINCYNNYFIQLDSVDRMPNWWETRIALFMCDKIYVKQARIFIPNNKHLSCDG